LISVNGKESALAIRVALPVVLLTGVLAISGCAAGSTTDAEGQPVDLRTEQTQWGPLNASDRDFLKKVRQAGLWEIPAGVAAQERAGSQRVKEIGKLIADEHVVLDQQTRDAAAQVGVILPDTASPNQQRFLQEMNDAKSPQAWDAVFVNRLRLAHGIVFIAVANVRAGTRNTVVRQLAEYANAAVLRHQTYLESTGLVDLNQIPEAPPPGVPNAVQLAATVGNNGGLGVKEVMIVLAIAVTSVLVTLGALWLVRGGPSTKRARRGRPTRGRPLEPGELLPERY
jgi:putative membrane protein